MIKLLLTIGLTMSIATGMQAAPLTNLQISMDSQLINFSSPPILKNGEWLVPLEPICQKFGFKVEVQEMQNMLVICGTGESELCVPLQIDKIAFNIDNVFYAKLESIIEPFGFQVYKVSEYRLEVVRPDQLAPVFTLPDLDDTPVRLQDYRGKKTLLYIWGSW